MILVVGTFFQINPPPLFESTDFLRKFKKNDVILENMPFNGLEFGNLILKERGLQNVLIEQTKIGDHYDLTEKKIKVLDERLEKKSITAISIVCHEIGHAIQHSENYKPLEQRNKIVKNTVKM